MDSSGSIGPEDYDEAKKNLAKLLSLLCPSPDPFKVSPDHKYQRAGMIKFSSTTSIVFLFDEHKNTSELTKAIEDVSYLGNTTCTGDAFILAANVFKNSKSRYNRLFSTVGII